MSSSNSPRPCPGCHRDRRECWRMPCLELETMLAKPRNGRQVLAWIRAGLPRELRKGLRIEDRRTGKIYGEVS